MLFRLSSVYHYYITIFLRQKMETSLVLLRIFEKYSKITFTVDLSIKCRYVHYLSCVK